LARGALGCLERGGSKTEGATVTDHHRFRRFAIAFISFLFYHVVDVVPAFSFVSNYCIGMVVILKYSRAKAYFEKKYVSQGFHI
jgi:hypothetical protein